MSHIAMKFVELQPYQAQIKKRVKQQKPGHCKACGAKLKDELSIQRGYGPECYQKWTAVVLEIVP